MRNFGVLLLGVGFLGFIYCSGQLSDLQPVPAGVEIGDYLRYEAGKWELGRFTAVLTAGIGLLLALFPKGR